jgi:hypothetical protein
MHIMADFIYPGHVLSLLRLFGYAIWSALMHMMLFTVISVVLCTFCALAGGKLSHPSSFFLHRPTVETCQ